MPARIPLESPAMHADGNKQAAAETTTCQEALYSQTTS